MVSIADRACMCSDNKPQHSQHTPHHRVGWVRLVFDDLGLHDWSRPKCVLLCCVGEECGFEMVCVCVCMCVCVCVCVHLSSLTELLYILIVITAF